MDVPRRLLDGTLGDWVDEQLRPAEAWATVGAVVPTGFPRVVRVLHPTPEGQSWAEVARASGTVLHPLVVWACIAPHAQPNGRGPDDAEAGSVAPRVLDAVLEHCPAEGDVVHGVWGGLGTWVDRPDETTLMPGWGGRSYVLFAGPKRAWVQWPGMDSVLDQSAHLIWPADRSWCIATDIDLDSTFVACPEPVADAILADERVEAFPVEYGDDVSWQSDHVNPRPDWLNR